MNTLNIISLIERQDRRDELLIELDKQGIADYKFWNGIKNKHYPKLGILQAHKQIVRFAKENNLPYVQIAEDDMCFFGKDKGAWEYYLSQLPNDADLFLSMLYVGDIDKDNRITSICSGFTMYTVFERFYDTFLSAPEDNGGVHVDRYITGLHEDYKFYVCNPFTTYQSGSSSDNTKRKTREDYSPLLRGRNIYGGI